MTPLLIALTWPPLLNRNAEIRVLSEVEKSSFYFFARQKGTIVG